MSDNADSSTQRRLELLVRQNLGRTQYRDYAVQLADMLRTGFLEEDRFDLVETDRLFAAYLNRSKENAHRVHLAPLRWSYQPASAWSDLCKCIGRYLKGQRAILYVGPFKYCGAVRIEVERALDSAQMLLDFDGDTVSLQSMDAESGLYLDKFDEDSHWFVELVAWGQWRAAVDSCLKT